jgi:signal transduction histidine kinase
MLTKGANQEPSLLTLNSVFDNSPFGIAIISSEKFEILNHPFCTIVSKNREDIIGKPIKTVFRKQDDYLKIIHLESFETLLSLENTQRSLMINPMPIFDREGLEKILLFVSDITKYHEASRQVSEQASQLYSVFNLTPSILLVLDEYTNVLNINDTALTIVNKAKENSIGLRPGDILNCIRSYDSPKGCGNGPQCKHCLVRKTVLETLLTGKNNYRVESPFLIKSSEGISTLTVLVSAISMKREEGNAVLVAIDDITERKKLETELEQSKEELQRKNSELHALNSKLLDSYKRIRHSNTELLNAKTKAEESDRLKSAFLANISHEVRTPLNGIVGFLELLNKNTLDSEQRLMYSKIVNQSADQLIHIITDIIEASRIESGQVQLKMANLNVNELLTGLYYYFEKDATEKKLHFKCSEHLADDKCYVLTDEDKLRQILQNLIDNAIKFTPAGHVEFGCRFSNNHVEFFVTDSGIGIDDKHRFSVFEYFRQVEISETREYGGTGLGLSIARSYVQLLGGSIWFDSVPAKGTSFYFTIPYTTVITDKSNNNMSIQERLIDWSDKTFLIVEDEEVNIHYLQELLEPTNARLVYSNSAEEAISQCKSNPNLDLVLMDIKLPGIDGYEATKVIKELRSDLPVIAQTAYAMSGDRLKAISAGCDDYIAKPIRADDLLQKIHHWIKV